MKTFSSFNTFLLLLTLTAITISCSKDKAKPEHDNFFQVGTELQFDLNSGFILDYGIIVADPEIHHMHTEFTTNGLSFDRTSGEFIGIGSAVNIGFYSDADGTIPTGTYTFDETHNILSSTFDHGYIWENFNTMDQTGHNHSITDGTVIVIYDGTFYDFKFDCMLNTGSKFVGTFKAICKYEDLSALN